MAGQNTDDLSFDRLLLKLAMQPEQPPPPYQSVSRHRLVIGLDYGTTYSGISFATTDKTSADDITVIRAWPHKDGEWKVPTRIAYASENPKTTEASLGISENQWGYGVEPWMTSCAWTKLRLDMDAQDRTYDDPALATAMDNGMLYLPTGVSAKQVCTDFLKEMYEHVSDRLTKQMSRSVLDSTPMDCWITVPAVWGDAAQSATKEAAKVAGFGSRPGDTINIISEPEAAAIAALKKYAAPYSPKPPKKGENIIVCDCGGGTVDLTTYTITEATERLEFEEVYVGIGGKCGSTYIDRNLHGLMHKRFGEAFDKIEMRRKGPGSRFMDSFERVKRAFTTKGEFQVKEIGPLRMDVPSSRYYDDDESMVRLTRQDIESLFAPVVVDIVRLVEHQSKELSKMRRLLNRVILIGGFGDSEYLYDKMKSWCSVNGHVELLCPEHPQAAIARGAAIRGLEGIAPVKKRCRRNYGVCYNGVFRPGVDPEERALTSQWNGEKLCRGRMDWLIRKGDEITADTMRTIELRKPATKKSVNWANHETRLFSCSSEDPPDYVENEGVEKVGQIRTDFSQADRSIFERKQSGGVFSSKLYALEFVIEVQFGSKGGGLEFKTLVGGDVLGTTDISFDSV